MTTTEIKRWIANILNAHREAIADEGLRLSVNTVWYAYSGVRCWRHGSNSDDEYLNICDAFRLCGYDIEC